MAEIRFHPEVEKQLDEMWDAADDANNQADLDAIVLIDVLIQELNDDPSTLDNLTSKVPRHHFDYNPPYEIKKFEECFERRMYVYTLKPYDEDNHPIGYRALLGHNPQSGTYWVLSVLPRSISYKPDTAEFKELCRRYNDAWLPLAPS